MPGIAIIAADGSDGTHVGTIDVLLPLTKFMESSKLSLL